MADNFGAQLTAWAEKTGQSLREVDVGFKLALFDRAVRRTRVDTGRMKGNWQITNGSPAAGETGAFKTNSSANKFQPEIGLTESDEALIAPFSVTYLTNNVPYAVVWEEVDAMAGGAISEARQLLAAELAKDD